MSPHAPCTAAPSHGPWSPVRPRGGVRTGRRRRRGRGHRQSPPDTVTEEIPPPRPGEPRLSVTPAPRVTLPCCQTGLVPGSALRWGLGHGGGAPPGYVMLRPGRPAESRASPLGTAGLSLEQPCVPGTYNKGVPGCSPEDYVPAWSESRSCSKSPAPASGKDQDPGQTTAHINQSSGLECNSLANSMTLDNPLGLSFSIK